MSVQAIVHVLENSQQHGTALLVLIAIANRADERGRDAWPSIATIAVMARTTERHVRRLLPTLERAGELGVDRGAGRHGTNLYTIVGVGGRQLPLPLVTPDNPSPRTPRTAGEDISSTSGVTSTSADTSSYPSVIRPGAHIEDRASRPPTERELRAATKAAVTRLEAEWLKGRAAIDSDRHVDRVALRNLRARCTAGLQRGIEERDLDEAVRELARDPKASPWYVDDVARQKALQRLEREHEARKAEERLEARQARDRQADADRASGALARVRDEGLHRLRVPEVARATIPGT